MKNIKIKFTAKEAVMIRFILMSLILDAKSFPEFAKTSNELLTISQKFAAAFRKKRSLSTRIRSWFSAPATAPAPVNSFDRRSSAARLFDSLNPYLRDNFDPPPKHHDCNRRCIDTFRAAFFFLFILLFPFFILHAPAQAQDYKLSLGRGWLRYDSDSNRFRFGSFAGSPRIAREFNTQLFDYNSSHFSWSTSTGLNLQDPVRHDSMWTQRLAITRDTGDGEFVPLQSRNYTLLKKSWYNNYMPFELQWFYRSFSGGTLIASDSCYAINNTEQVYNAADVVLAASYSTIQEITLPVKGLYIIYINYDYEFTAGPTDTTVADEISVRLIQYPSTSLGSATQKFNYLLGFSMMSRGSASIVIPYTSPGPDETLYLQSRATNNAHSTKYLRQITVTYLLVR
ncbi:hypothetical protein D4R99_03455 [bacterium]|nr:MAG: hypothetical protein D4R99_03455 [bacterium]